MPPLRPTSRRLSGPKSRARAAYRVARAHLALKHWLRGQRSAQRRWERRQLAGAFVALSFVAVVLLSLGGVLLVLGLWSDTTPTAGQHLTETAFGLRLAGANFLALGLVLGLVAWAFYLYHPLGAVLTGLLILPLLGFVLLPTTGGLLSIRGLVLALMLLQTAWALWRFRSVAKALRWRHLWPLLLGYWGQAALLALFAYGPSLPAVLAGWLPDVLMLSVAVGLVAWRWRSLRGLFRWRRSHWRWLLRVVVLAVPIACTVWAMTLAINALLGGQTGTRSSDALAAGGSVVWLVLAWAVLPAITEELLYRGFVQGELGRWLRPWAAWVSAAVLFAFAHSSYVSFYWLVPFGLYLGYLRVRSRSLWVPMLAHLLHNALQLAIGWWWG